MSEEIKKLLDKHNYRIVVVETEGGCDASYPGTVIIPPRHPISVRYQYTPDSVITTAHNQDGDLVSFTNQCPVYAQRLYVLYHIVRNCSFIAYPFPLVKFIYKQEEMSGEDFFGYVNNTLFDQNDVVKEDSLGPLLSLSLTAGFKFDEDAKKLGVEDGYSAIKAMFLKYEVKEEDDNKETEDIVDE